MAPSSVALVQCCILLMSPIKQKRRHRYKQDTSDHTTNRRPRGQGGAEGAEAGTVREEGEGTCSLIIEASLQRLRTNRRTASEVA